MGVVHQPAGVLPPLRSGQAGGTGGGLSGGGGGLLTGGPLSFSLIALFFSSIALCFLMGVPAHDQRDFDFAKKFSLDIIPTLNFEEINRNYTKKCTVESAYTNKYFAQNW